MSSDPMLSMQTQGQVHDTRNSGGTNLWEKAPGWRNLTVAASLLTLVAVAIPTFLPEPAQISVPPSTHALPHNAVALNKAAAPAIDAAMIPQSPTASPEHLSPGQQEVLPAQKTKPTVNQSPLSVAHSASRPPHTAQPPSPEPLQQPTENSQAAANGPTQNSSSVTPDLPVGTIVVPSGVVSRIVQHNRYNPSLGGDLPITITIVSPPAHGTVTIQEGQALLSFPNAGVTRMSNVKKVMYQSEPGYVGQDSFTYRRTSTDPNDPLNGRTYTMNLYAK